MKRPHGQPRRPSAPARGPARPAGSPRGQRHRRGSEETFYGVRACEALFEARPGDIVRVYVTARRKPTFAALLAFCARERKGFQIVADENLARLTGSIHHEGIAILAKSVPVRDLAWLLGGLESGRILGPLVYLDGVQNPHNVGSMLRTAAHFGVTAVIGAAEEMPGVSAATARVAEGAAEHVPLVTLAVPAADLARIGKLGFDVVATSSHGGEPVWAAAIADARKVVLVLGSEGEGVSRGIARVCDRTVQIPGTGIVESLNVSVACGVLLAELRRRT